MQNARRQIDTGLVLTWGSDELRLVAALSMLFGWTVWGRQILHTMKYPDSAVDEVRAQVAELAGELLPATEGHR